MKLTCSILLFLLLCSLAGFAQMGLGSGSWYGPTIDYYADLVSPAVQGDTNHITLSDSTFADGSSAGTMTLNRNDGQGNVTINGRALGTLNDGGGGSISGAGNIWLYKFDVLDLATGANNVITSVNKLTSFGTTTGGQNSPAGWLGKCSSNASAATDCSWKSSKPAFLTGSMILPTFRQSGSGFASSDSTLIFSPDGGQYLINPYHFFQFNISNVACTANIVTLTTATNTFTVGGGDVIWVHGANAGANGKYTTISATPTTVTYSRTCGLVTVGSSSGNASPMSATGDAPTCGAVAVPSDTCHDASYTDSTHSSIMWPDISPYNGSTNRMGRIKFIEYSPGNATTGMPDDADTYLYALSCTGAAQGCYLGRVLKDIEKVMDPAQWQWYNYATYQPSDVGDGTSWTSTLSSAVQIFGGITVTENDLTIRQTGLGGTLLGEYMYPVYVCTNGTCGYVAVSDPKQLGASEERLGVVSMGHPWGPFKLMQTLPLPDGGFGQFIRFTMWAPDSFPGNVCMGTIWDTYAHTGSASIFMRNFCLHMTPVSLGLQPRGNFGLKFSYGPAKNAIILRGLVHWFDFDAPFIPGQGMSTIFPSVYSLDLVTSPSTTQLLGCYTDSGTVTCGYPNSGKGMSLDSYGVLLNGAAYVARLELRNLVGNTGTPNNVYGGLSDTTFTANGGDTSWTYSTTVRSTNVGTFNGLFNCGPVSALVYTIINDTGSLSLGFNYGSNTYVLGNTAIGVVSANTWYNLVFVYEAGGVLNAGNVTNSTNTGRIHIYKNGVPLPITFQGINTSSGTPNVTAATVTVGYSVAGSTQSVVGTVAQSGWYNRALASWEVAHNYTVIKAEKAKIGISMTP